MPIQSIICSFMSTDFSQMSLDSTVPIGVKQLQEAKEKIETLEAQLSIYEKQRIQHEDLEKHMRNSYTSFNRDIESLKKNLVIAELRCQELKEENLKLNAQLSGKIDLMLKERQSLYQILADHNTNWFVADRPTTVFLKFCCHKFEQIELQIDTDEKKITHVRGINPV